jgi:hypothetical protein
VQQSEIRTKSLEAGHTIFDWANRAAPYRGKLLVRDGGVVKGNSERLLMEIAREKAGDVWRTTVALLAGVLVTPIAWGCFVSVKTTPGPLVSIFGEVLPIVYNMGIVLSALRRIRRCSVRVQVTWIFLMVGCIVWVGVIGRGIVMCLKEPYARGPLFGL